jgi:hypothetical protein
MPLELELRPMSAEERLQKRIGELERQVRDLQRQIFAVPINAGAPAAGDGKSGSLAGDTTNTRLWVKLGSTWRYVTLT